VAVVPRVWGTVMIDGGARRGVPRTAEIVLAQLSQTGPRGADSAGARADADAGIGYNGEARFPARRTMDAAYDKGGSGPVTAGETTNDATRRILRALERDARLTPAALATMTGVGADEVAAIVARAERDGVIRQYKAVVDWERAGDERVVAFIDVSVSPQRDVGFDQVAARIYRYPEVRSVHLVSGGSDLRVVVAGPDMRHVAAFVAEKLAPIEHVTATNTHFLLKTYKEDGVILAEEQGSDGRLAVMP